MAWVRLDDRFDEHPKVARLSDSAFALFVSGLAYCNRNLTDGFIPHQVGMGQLRYCDGNTIPPIRELEEVGLWVRSVTGWHVHDYLEFQPSKQQVEKERAELHRVRSEAGRKGAEVRWGKSPGQDGNEWQTDNPNPKPNPDKATAASNGFVAFNAKRAVDAVRKRQRDGLPVKSPGGLARTIAADPDHVQESQQLWLHRDCESCKGKGFLEGYAPGAGTIKKLCEEPI